MPDIVLLDTGVLGALTHPNTHPTARPWLNQLRRQGIRVLVPEIADYELRRELLRL
jgi:predicted nucleic acid-binding protein